MNYEKDLRDQGYAVLNSSELLEDVREFYLDIVRYLSLVLKDSGKFSHQEKAIDTALEQDSIFEIDNVLQKALYEVQLTDRTLLGHLYDMGTRPNKFLSAEKLFFNSEIQKVIQIFFSSKGIDNPLLVKPLKGETLHLFTPGETQYKYNLPIHQDYQYLGQSSDQITFWLSLSGEVDTGGVRFFPGTHRNGPVECEKDEHGHFEVPARFCSKLDYEKCIDFFSKPFTVVAMDSLLFHQSLRSYSKRSSRITYIWRVSNIGSGSRTQYGKSF